MKKIAIVTGSNTGLGFSLVKKLCGLLGDNGIVYLTSRDKMKGQEALKQLNEIGLHPNFHLLDVTSDSSVNTFSEYIKNTYGGVDILFHNAAARISPTQSKQEQIENFIDTNNLGTTRIIKAFQPLIRDNSKFVIVASSFGSLNNLNNNLHYKFDISKQTLDGINDVMKDYVKHVNEGNDIKEGWPEWMNIPSKIGQVASMKVLAREVMGQNAKERNIMILAVCPGLMDTEASRPWFKDMSKARLPDDAADDLIWLISQKEWDKERFGTLVQYRKVISWDNK
jgi:NAD(P)-dependent dehydrogenase (short-subunit alcohol dehydrogenase family)